MSSALATKCCCSVGCGCNPCTGNFFPATATLTFTPWWFCGWTGGTFGGCSYSGPTAPTDCDNVIPSIGALPAWYQSSAVVLTCNAVSAGSSCYRVLESSAQAVAVPSGLPAFSSNPIGISSSAADWCSLETGRTVWGAGGKFANWKARIIFKGTQCDAAASGTDINTVISVAQILLDDDVVWARSYYSVSDAETAENCSCFGGDFGSAGQAWTQQCPGADCDDWSAETEDYYGGVKWPVYGGSLGTSAFSWASSRGNPCCEDLSGVMDYYGCNDASTPTTDCPDCDAPGPCGASDANHLLALGLDWPPDNASAPLTKSYHVATDYGDGSCIGAWCMVQRLGFTTSGIPGFTDVTLSPITV